LSDETYLIGGPRDGDRIVPDEHVPPGYLPWMFDDYPGIHYSHVSLKLPDVEERLRRREAEELRAQGWESRTGMGWGNSIASNPNRVD